MRMTNKLRRWVVGCLLTAALDFCVAEERPNFVWLISEDNSKHFLELYDEKMGAPTPRIAALAEEGLVFENAYSNSPVCSVARTTLMTACFGPRIGTQFHRKAVTVPMPEGVRMFPAWLREAGYFTTNNRKKDYNAVEGAGVWDESSNRAHWRSRKPGQPFFHMQSFGVTHESSLHFSESVLLNEKTETDPASVTLAPYHPDTATFRYTYARYHDRIKAMDQQIGAVVNQLAADGLLENTFIFYFGDHGGVLPGSKGYAKERGLHVPLVVRIPEKYRETIDFEIGSRVEGFVSFVDFGPTLLHLAGLDSPKTVDGIPFLGDGVNQLSLSRRDEVFGYADRFDEKYDLVRTIRKGRFSYVRNYQPFNFDGLQNNYRYIMLAYEEWRQKFHGGQLNDVQRQFFETKAAEALYDVDADPHEIDNLAGYPEYHSILIEMRGLLQDRLKSLPDLSFLPESELVEHAFDNPTHFGKVNRGLIERLIDVADLSLLPFSEARNSLQNALRSPDSWIRYWALIACSSHGSKASEFASIAREMARGDDARLVRVRAAEFLGLIGEGNPSGVFLKELEECRSGIEACLILNSVVLLRDGEPRYRIPLNTLNLRPSVAAEAYVQRRIEYLEGESRSN